jgi:hypothetical protein
VLCNTYLGSPCERCLYVCRNINYWISDAEWPDVRGGEQFFTEAYEVSRNVLYSVSVVFSLVSHTGKVFIFH